MRQTAGSGGASAADMPVIGSSSPYRDDRSGTTALRLAGRRPTDHCGGAVAGVVPTSTVAQPRLPFGPVAATR